MITKYGAFYNLRNLYEFLVDSSAGASEQGEVVTGVLFPFTAKLYTILKLFMMHQMHLQLSKIDQLLYVRLTSVTKVLHVTDVSTLLSIIYWYSITTVIAQ